MFTVICTQQQSGRLRQLFSRQEYYLNTVSEGRVRFFVLTVKGGKKVNWERLYHMLGEQGQGVLLQEGLIPPTAAFFRSPNTAEYTHRMACNAAEKILRRRAAFREEKILFLDENLEFAEEANQLLRYCDRLTVMTDRTQGYFSLNQWDIRYIPIGSELPLQDYSFAFAPRLSKRVTESGFDCGRTPLVVGVAEDITQSVGTVMTGFAAPLPEQYRLFLPERVDELDFAAALYCCCGETALGEVFPDRCDIYQDGKPIANRTAF
ncbi:MAG: hypothetical protein IJD11_02245 [Oscillospiraceae bacterium]|nr:hypothetical protein [Oscillospiraceae bacterium]